jgi:ribosomal protein S24E
MANRKSTKGQTTIYKHTYNIKDQEHEHILKPEWTVPITTKAVSSNPVHDEMYSMQH